MMHVVLHEPEIPQNTGNVVRTCKSTGSVLHLIEPLGFEISNKRLKRAGLDYWNDMDIRIYNNIRSFCDSNPNSRIWLVETRGDIQYHQAGYSDGDYLIFGKETSGLPESVLEMFPGRCVRVPMVKDNRSLNLSNAVAIVLYEALRQTGFSFLL